MRRLFLCLSCAVLFLAAREAAADSEAGVEIHLTQQAQKTLTRDRIRVELRVEALGSDSRQVQDEVNKRMALALAGSRRFHAVTAQTGNYTVYRDQDPKAMDRWHASQSLILTSADPTAILPLAGDLQADGLVMSGMHFSLAPETLKAAQSELTAQALTGLRDRAAEIAADLGMTVDRYQQLTIGNATESFEGVRMMQALPGPAAPPAAQPGDSTVGVTVQADILLRSR